MPDPAVFITAYSEAPADYLSIVSTNIITNILEILDKAQNKYGASLIFNEPTSHTHNINLKQTKNAVAICCSLRFQNVLQMSDFIQKEIKNEQ